MSAAFHPPAALRASTLFFVLLVVLVADAEGRHHVLDCPPFSCGQLRHVSHPFRRRGDPPGCGVPSYELVCTDAKASIRIGSGTYDVVSIHYNDSTFWVVEADWGTQRSCLLPHWDRHVSEYEYGRRYRYGRGRHNIELEPSTWMTMATFVNCSKPIENKSTYRPVACLSTNSSFVYVMTGFLSSPAAENFEPSCGYLAMTPLGGRGMMVPNSASYPDVVKFMRNGFYLRFPFSIGEGNIRECLAESMRTFFEEPRNSTGIKDNVVCILMVELLWNCVIDQLSTNNAVMSVLIYIIEAIPLALWALKSTHVVCRFVLMPLAVFIFLAYKYWKTRISIDAVEKFLRMQQMLVPMRYAYTDIIAITSHFREKLGQGGYGSVYKGVLLPGEVHVAIKMLGKSNCNGEEFISEVATIGKIHHINVVRLVGFCSEEMSRALIYEFMPHGSLDKYIFSSERTFSWDKLNEIALGIARGINYLHQGCDMQIVHFDIKPHNILLDSNFVPKVADFGLAKLFPRDDSFVPLSAMRGTIGYIAPEMVSRSFGLISSKSDVYSFGMLLLEMTGGRRNVDPHAGSSSQAYYPSFVYSQLRQAYVGGISEGVDMHKLEKKLCIIGLWCIQMKPQDRPTMSEVIEMLELEAGVDDIQMPPRPFFCDDECGGSYSISSKLNAIEEEDE
ncbi:hypothetical protein SORBI_3003G096500 [Sorghum bicolor]|uniref:Protein kinase domain-containing protein n=1 Tax=Sorghum bicolor TaxID=4558 RepID=C5XEA8_SORBI|nr:hypothetical protein SORBI_3003G096500 [Sorghum bicolor]